MLPDARRAIGILLLLGATAVTAACASERATQPTRAAEQEPLLRVNELQLIGTHNSYHVAPDQAVFDVMRATGYRESAQWTGERLATALAFTHPPIAVQLAMGLRVFEFDVQYDPEGGRYATPGFLRALDPAVAAGLSPVDPHGELRKPGMQVFHAADSDVRSRCLRFTVCLETIRDWSLAHPQHLPVFIQIETKEGRKPPIAQAYEPAAPAPFDDAAWRRLHEEIEAVFAPEQIVRPAEVRGGHASVNAAVRADGWPPLAAMRGRVVFLLLDSPPKQDEYAAFTRNGPEPLLFVSRDPDDPSTAWLIRPKPRYWEIRPLVEQGFLVYTRADAHGAEARRNDFARARAAFSSGAQLIATDFPAPDPRHGPYRVSFEGRYVRCNPLLKPADCDPGRLADDQPGSRNVE